MFKSKFEQNAKVVSAMVMALFMSGCGKLDFTLTSLIPGPVSTKATAQGVEAVSSSAVGKRTVANGYLVDASVGAVRDKLVTVTPSGYKIYHGVRGSIVSEQ